MAQALQELAPGAQLCAQAAWGEAELLGGLRFGREDLVPAYKALSEANRSFYNREEFAEYLALRTDRPRHMCYLAAGILLELGFAAVQEERGIGFVAGAPQRKLEESRTFHTLLELERYAKVYADRVGEE